MRHSKTWIGCLAALALFGCFASPEDIGEEDLGERELGVLAQPLPQIDRERAMEWKQLANYALVGDRVTPYSNHGNGASAGYALNNCGIYFSDATNQAQIVQGLIRNEYVARGAQGGFLGYPTTDELSTLYGTGRYNNFQGGRIMWKNGNGKAYEVHGCNLALYDGLGTEWGWQGFPLAGEHQFGDRRRSIFEYGRIYFRAAGSGNCLDSSWAVHTGVNPQQRLSGSGKPQITKVLITTTGSGTYRLVTVEGSGFSPGAVTVSFTGPNGHTAFLHPTAGSNGAFYVSGNVANTSIVKVNGYATIMARQVSAGKVAATPFATLHGISTNDF